MSAYLVDQQTIKDIVLAYNSAKNLVIVFSCEELSDMANTLYAENNRSVNYRYSENTVVDDIAITLNDVDHYEYIPIKKVLKLIGSVDYQSCETNDYETTGAYKLLKLISEFFMNDASAISNDKIITQNLAQAKKDAEQLAFDEAVKILPDLHPLFKPSPSPYNIKFAAKNIRILLKKYKGVKFSVRIQHTAINIRWEDGPTSDEIKADTAIFDAGHFDHYQDIMETKITPFHQCFGSSDYIFTHREYSNKLKQAAIDVVYSALKANFELDGRQNPTINEFDSGALIHYKPFDKGFNVPINMHNMICEQIHKTSLL